ncbi:TIGR01906 family membrane protein [Rothia sp. AR01]|uniref:TIGR01906 family membrane protein n=1 Tax=Rothia santali TaxID=2949643 RepID=A0A9X2HL86_9MICC|nr:TIGR01906 family membrane protein [Rothia santali]MCP3427008.1 TIGR01906 family membrane protein [Rothia santali]
MGRADARRHRARVWDGIPRRGRGPGRRGRHGAGRRFGPGPRFGPADAPAGEHPAGASAPASPAPRRPRALRLRQALIALAVPLVTLALALRAVASPLFLWIEYHRPGFPADPYGFSPEERMTYGSHGLDYILNFAPERYLGDVVLGNGDRAFTAPEIGHMTDVKHVLLWALLAVAVFALVAAAGALGLRRRAPGSARRALFLGGWLTLALMLALGVSAALGWESFFVAFHELFFPQGNWAFRLSDTLIRLYPPQFWVDAAATVGALALIVSTALLAATWPRSRRRRRA